MTGGAGPSGAGGLAPAGPGATDGNASGGTGIDWSAAARRPPSRRRRLAAVAIGVTVAAVIAAAVVASGDLSSPAACTPPIPKVWTSGHYAVIKPCGTRVTIGSGAYLGYSAGRFSDAQIVLGKFSSSVPIGAYLLNGTEFTALEGNSSPLVPPTGWFWSCGIGPTCNVNATVPPSPPEYFLVLYDFGSTNASVVWSLSLIVAYLPDN